MRPPRSTAFGPLPLVLLALAPGTASATRLLLAKPQPSNRRKAARKPTPAPAPPRTYLFHEECRGNGGLGGQVAKMRPYISIALEKNLTYICNPGDFDTALHNTGNMGYLFGCFNKSYVVGDLAAYNKVKQMSLSWQPYPLAGPPQGKPPTPQPGSASSARPGPPAKNDSRALLPGVVYTIKECKPVPPWGVSYRWLSSQYHLVRQKQKARRRSACWDPKPFFAPIFVKGWKPRKNVVIAMRKGDSPTRSPGGRAYSLLLAALFDGKIPGAQVTKAMTNLVVISETTEEDPTVEFFKQHYGPKNTSNTSVPVLRKARRGRRSDNSLGLKLFLGTPEEDEKTARTRIVRDLDCMALSDVLILSDSGFSDLGAALQRAPGIALVFGVRKNKDRTAGLPNIVNVNTKSIAFRQGESSVEVYPHEELPNARRVIVTMPGDPSSE
mmetsp:Transcript_46659/g.133067  ORF Transcript_46659/g.133067 Transcript_46659/m.133067 type:complete len:440 (-) Transcript_46659:38-1357(-)